MTESKAQGLSVGFGKRDITPLLGTPLAGRPMLPPRRARTIRDPLYARALHIKCGSTQITLLSVDLLLVTQSLVEAVAGAAGVAREDLAIFATHTHSGPGGYWKGSLVEWFMGPFRPATYSLLVQRLAEAVKLAVHKLVPAELSVASMELAHMSSNRREAKGLVDPVLTLCRFDLLSGQPISVVSFGAHPITGLEREPRTVTADYPGEACRRIEAGGSRAMFLQGAAAATNPGWIHGPLEKHLQHMGDMFEEAIGKLEQRLQPLPVSEIAHTRLPLEVEQQEPLIVPDGMRGGKILELAARPLQAALGLMSRQGRAANRHVALTVIRIGPLVVIGAPCELGPRVSLDIRDLFARTSTPTVMVASMCDGYVGYVHMVQDYEARRGTRVLALYENAMSMAGRDAGNTIVEVLKAHGEGIGESISPCIHGRDLQK